VLHIARPILGAILAVLLPIHPVSAVPLTPTDRATIDASAQAQLAASGVPAISLAIVLNGQLAYAQAYGAATLAPFHCATVTTRFPIGSVSKQFTAAAILLLADQGKLALTNPVAKFLPQLQQANAVTLRDLLNHTAGYRDYFEQELIPAEKQRPTTVQTILQRWAIDIPPDFPPGSQWQYSGTNYVILGRIVEIVSGQPFYTFLNQHILRPLGIDDATLADSPAPTTPTDATGYLRYALGPRRPAPRIGQNWLFAMAGLSMTAADVAKWDISVVHHTLLSQAATQAMEHATPTTNGEPTNYGLGFFIDTIPGPAAAPVTLLRHPGEISGFRALNDIVPATGTALVILTNAEYSAATSDLATRLEPILHLSPIPHPRADTPQARRAVALLQQLQHGAIDTTQLAPDAAASFTPQALADIRQSLSGLGALQQVMLTNTTRRAGTTHYALTVTYALRQLQIAEYDLPNGRIEQFLIDTISDRLPP
jgi:CubicO group peptidase (beta-lactamase class C family)